MDPEAVNRTSGSEQSGGKSLTKEWILKQLIKLRVGSKAVAKPLQELILEQFVDVFDGLGKLPNFTSKASRAGRGRNYYKSDKANQLDLKYGHGNETMKIANLS